MEVECTDCASVKDKFSEQSVFQHVFVVHVTGIHPVHSSKLGSKHRRGTKDPRSIKERRQKMRNQVHRLICALQNSGGGAILLHLAEQEPEDQHLGYFDEFINPIFQTVTEDGSMAFELYSRRWLSDSDELSECKQFVCLSVLPLSYISTVEYNTKIRNDVESSEPTLRCLLKCLKREDSMCTKPAVRGLEENMSENRNTEFKSWNYGTEKLHGAKDIAEFIWYKLRLRENITSMSKIQEGGSMYVGVDEVTVEKATYRTVQVSFSGIQRTVECERLRHELQTLAHTHLVVLNSNRIFENAPEDLFSLTFHDVGPGVFVLEVSVRYIPGVVFYDKNGPRSYKIDNGSARRMEKDEWVANLPDWGD